MRTASACSNVPVQVRALPRRHRRGRGEGGAQGVLVTLILGRELHCMPSLPDWDAGCAAANGVLALAPASRAPRVAGCARDARSPGAATGEGCGRDGKFVGASPGRRGGVSGEGEGRGATTFVLMRVGARGVRFARRARARARPRSLPGLYAVVTVPERPPSASTATLRALGPASLRACRWAKRSSGPSRLFAPARSRKTSRAANERGRVR